MKNRDSVWILSKIKVRSHAKKTWNLDPKNDTPKPQRSFFNLLVSGIKIGPRIILKTCQFWTPFWAQKIARNGSPPSSIPSSSQDVAKTGPRRAKTSPRWGKTREAKQAQNDPRDGQDKHTKSKERPLISTSGAS